MFKVLIAALLVLSPSCEAGVGYVKPKNNSTSCSFPACEYLNFYANGSFMWADNYSLLFLPGHHDISLNFVVNDASFLVFMAENESNKDVLITCAEGVGFVFRNVRTLTLKGLAFQHCSINSSQDMYSAVLFDHIINLTLLNVVIQNSSGYGVLVKNAYGKSLVENCNFLYNGGSSTHAGGNAYIDYSNCSSNFSNKVAAAIKIQSSNFSYGGYRGHDYSPHSGTLATGLAINLSCSVHLYINKVNVMGNSNDMKKGFGGNMFIHFYNPYHYISSRVYINATKVIGGRGALGAGLGVTFFMKEIGKKTNFCNNSLEIANTEFSRNTGVSGCGIYLEFVTPTVRSSCLMDISVVDSSFLHNVADLAHFSFQWNIGVAIFILSGYVRNSLRDVEPVSILFDNITVQGNEASYKNEIVSATEVSAAIVSSKYLGKFVISNSKILDNLLSGMALFKSNVLMEGVVLIRNNSGINGGGLILCAASYIQFYPNTTINFYGNKATLLGGAIYSESQCKDSHPNCFYQFASFPECETSIQNCLTTVFTMENNTAGNAGMDIYGGNVANCYFHRTSLDYRVHSESFYKIFGVSKNVFGHFSAVTSDPIKVCACHSNKYDCSQTKFQIGDAFYPGQQIHYPVVVVGQLNGTVRGSVLVNGEMPFAIIHTNHCTNVPINISDGVTTYVVQVTNLRIPHYEKFLKLSPHLNSLTLDVHIKGCPIGFILRNGKCICNGNPRHSWGCNIMGPTITRQYGSWIGYNSWNNTEYVPGIIYHEICPLDYCDGSIGNIPVSEIGIDMDVQCSPHHTGLLCGACEVNYSVALDSTKCLDCRNTPILYPFLLSIGFIVSEVVLIVILILLDINITDGMLTGFLFYANMLYSNKELFRFTGTNFLTVVISIINLDMALNSCFFDGMDTYFKTWLKLCLPQSLWLLIITIIFLSKKYNRVAKLVGRNSAKIIVTLVELTFTRTLQACIVIFSCTSLEYPSHNDTVIRKLVWLHDANVEYFHGKHIALSIAGGLFSVFLLFYTTFLLFVQPLQRYSHVYCFLWVNRLKPLIDAYTAPHVIKARCRFWGGLLLLLRIVLSVYIAANIKNNPNKDFCAIMLICFLIFALSFVTGGIYKSVWLNLLNGSFFANLALLTLGMNYLFSTNKSFYFGYLKNKSVSSIIVYSSSGVAVSEALAVLIFCFFKKQRKHFHCKFYRRYLKRKDPSETNSLLEYSQVNRSLSCQLSIEQ